MRFTYRLPRMFDELSLVVPSSSEGLCHKWIVKDVLHFTSAYQQFFKLNPLTIYRGLADHIISVSSVRRFCQEMINICSRL